MSQKPVNPIALAIAKIIIGTGIVGLIIYMVPGILDLLYISAMIVGLPLVLLAAVGLSTNGIYDLITADARSEVEEHLKGWRYARTAGIEPDSKLE
jgi:hypothetical protein